MTSDDRLDETERFLYQQLVFLQEEYQKAAKPIVDQLVFIKNLRAPVIVIHKDQWINLQNPGQTKYQWEQEQRAKNGPPFTNLKY